MKHCRECDVVLVRGENWNADRKICRPCRAEYNREWRKANPGYMLEYNREHRKANPECTRDWRKANPKYQSEWRKSNPGKTSAYRAKRRAALLERTPPWLTKQHLEDIEAFYEWSEYLDGPHEVDHMVPLQGKLVSGLHVPWNLRVLTKDEHKYKLNKFEV